MTDAEIEVGFKLAYCLHPDALVAEYIIAEAWRALEQYPKTLAKRRVARERISEKRRQQTAPELGQAGEQALLASDRQSRPSEPETQSTKRILPEACRFQYTVYSVSARWERDQEGPQRLPPQYAPTRDDCLVRYVKFLIWKTTDQARFHYVVGGLGCLLYTYSPQEIGMAASHFWGEPIDVARIVNGYRFNEKVKGQIQERGGKGIRGWVIERFQSTGLELDGPGAIGTRGPHAHETALMEHACEVFTPWGSSDVDPPPQAPSEASPEGAWTAWYQQRVAWAQAWSDWQRVHALIHPACGGVPRLIHTYNAEAATVPSERLPDPQDKLRMPRFHSRIQPPNPGAPDRFVPPSFIPEGARRIRTLYERLRSRVTSGRFRLLRVYVDGEERQQFGLALGVGAPFSIPLEASCIEVVGEDAEGELSLALFLLSELDNDDQECQFWVRLEGGQTLTLQVWPVVQAETGEVTAYRLQVAYKEALQHSLLAWLRRVWASLQGAAAVVLPLWRPVPVLTAAVLLSLTLYAYHILAPSGGGGILAPSGGGGGSARVMSLIVVHSPTNPQPLPNVQVLGGGGPATTGPDGRTTVPLPMGQAGSQQPQRLILQFPDGSQNIYRLTVPAGQETAAATLFADPVAATTTTPGVMVMPTSAAPAGTIDITEPPNGATITCAPPPAVCRFAVQGHASLVLSQPDTRFRVFVSVTPVRPSGGGTMPQFPPVSVDPATGLWHVEAQIGSQAFQAQPGDTFQIRAVVTDARLTQGTVANPLRFDRPVGIPGVVHISPVVNLTVAASMAWSEVVVLVAPPDAECTNLLVTFRWRIDNRRPGSTYCSDVLTDKGVHPFDGRFDNLFHAGQATALQIPLEPRVYDPATFEWGVRVTACTTPGVSCEDRDPPCQGRVLESDVRRLRTSSQAPNCP